MRFRLLTIMLCGLLGLPGCFLSSTPSYNWSKNIAMDANSIEPKKFHDDNLWTLDETAPIRGAGRDEASQLDADKYTEAVLEWGKSQPIQHIVVKAPEGELEFFEIQYMNHEGKWVTVKQVRDNLREVYKFTLRQPIMTKKFRLKVPRRWDSRRVGGQKRATRGETGAPTTSEYKKIQEIEIYYALPPETPDTATTE